MTLESVTYIEDLDEDYPAEGEVGTLHEGNDHIRNIKKAVKNSWANALQTTPTTSYTLTVPSTGPWNIWKFGAGYTGNVWEVQNSSGQRVSTFSAYSATITSYAGYTAGGASGFVASSGAGTLNDFAVVQGDTANGANIRVGRPYSGYGSSNPFEYSAPNTTDLFYVSNTGQVGGTGAFLNISDARDKTAINDCLAGLQEILALRPVTFEYLSRPGVQNYGFIAQEVQGVLPNAVSLFSKNDRLGLAYEQILAPLVKAVQELAERVAKLEG
jgi:hypothetical protein